MDDRTWRISKIVARILRKGWSYCWTGRKSRKNSAIPICQSLGKKPARSETHATTKDSLHVNVNSAETSLSSWQGRSLSIPTGDQQTKWNDPTNVPPAAKDWLPSNDPTVVRSKSAETDPSATFDHSEMHTHSSFIIWHLKESLAGHFHLFRQGPPLQKGEWTCGRGGERIHPYHYLSLWHSTPSSPIHSRFPLSWDAKLLDLWAVGDFWSKDSVPNRWIYYCSSNPQSAHLLCLQYFQSRQPWLCLHHTTLTLFVSIILGPNICHGNLRILIYTRINDAYVH